MLSNEVSSQEWQRLELYASFVGSLGAIPPSRRGDPTTGRTIAPSTWAYVARLNAGKPLLPHLLQLVWVWRSPQSTEILQLVAPALISLEVICYDTRPDKERARGFPQEEELSFQLMISTALSVAPDLQVLYLGLKAPQLDTVVQLLGRLEKLDRLSFGDSKVDADALRAVAEKALTYLYLHDVDLPDNAAPSFCGFSHLEMLVIEVHPNNNRIYEVLSSPDLDAFRVGYYPGSVSRRTLLESVQWWARCFPVLRRIECSIDSAPSQTEAVGVVCSITHVLQPLLRLPTIADIVVNYPEGEFTLDDIDIDNITRAWPELVVLELGPPGTAFPFGTQPVIPTSPGVDSLRHLTSRCPHLRSLRLPHLRLPKPVLERLDDYPQSDHAMPRLHVYRVDVADWSLGGRFLDRFFPRLDIDESVFKATPAGGWDRLEYETLDAQYRRRAAAGEDLDDDGW